MKPSVENVANPTEPNTASVTPSEARLRRTSGMASPVIRTIPHMRRRVRPMHRGALFVLYLLLFSICFMLYVAWLRAPSPGSHNVVRSVCPPYSHLESGVRKRPRSLVVVSAGGSRSGSTVLFNALRILLRIRDPNSVSGWHTDLRLLHERYGGGGGSHGNHTGDILAAFRGVSSVLVKVHLVQEWAQLTGSTQVAPLVDAVFTTHRDVRQVVRSMRDMGWANAVNRAALEDANFCIRPARRKVRRVREAEYEKADTWVTQARAHLKCRAALLNSAGDKLKDDIKAESLTGLDEEKTVRLMERLGKHLEYIYSRDELVAAARELMRLEAPNCEDGDAPFLQLNPVTHLHRGHVQSVGNYNMENAQSGARAIAEDAECRDWLVRHGYAVK